MRASLFYYESISKSELQIHETNARDLMLIDCSSRLLLSHYKALAESKHDPDNTANE